VAIRRTLVAARNELAFEAKKNIESLFSPSRSNSLITERTLFWFLFHHFFFFFSEMCFPLLFDKFLAATCHVTLAQTPKEK
jgi:hypothetical protein